MTTTETLTIPASAATLLTMLHDPDLGFVRDDAASDGFGGSYTRFRHSSGVTVDLRSTGIVRLRAFGVGAFQVDFDEQYVPTLVVVAAILAAIRPAH